MAEFNTTRPAVLDAKNDQFNFGNFKLGGIPQPNQANFQVPIMQASAPAQVTKKENPIVIPERPQPIQGGSLTSAFSGIGAIAGGPAGAAAGGGIGLIGDLALKWWEGKKQEKAISKQMAYLENQQARMDKQARKDARENRRRFDVQQGFAEEQFDFNKEQALEASNKEKFMLTLQLLANRAQAERGLI